jgi:hypothetical protein
MSIELARQFLNMSTGSKGGSLKIPNLGSISAAIETQMTSLEGIANLDTAMTPRQVTQIGRQANEVEGANTIASEGLKQLQKKANGTTQSQQLLMGHQVATGNVALTSAQNQARFSKEVAKLGLQMGVTDAEQQGFQSGFNSARTTLFGKK